MDVLYSDDTNFDRYDSYTVHRKNHALKHALKMHTLGGYRISNRSLASIR